MIPLEAWVSSSSLQSTFFPSTRLSWLIRLPFLSSFSFSRTRVPDDRVRQLRSQLPVSRYLPMGSFFPLASPLSLLLIADAPRLLCFVRLVTGLQPSQGIDDPESADCAEPRPRRVGDQPSPFQGVPRGCRRREGHDRGESRLFLRSFLSSSTGLELTLLLRFGHFRLNSSTSKSTPTSSSSVVGENGDSTSSSSSRLLTRLISLIFRRFVASYLSHFT